MVRRTKHLSVRDGNLIPLGNNFAYVLGDHPNKVDDVDIGPNTKNGLSVNHGEIMQFGRNGVRVFSAEPILNGISPSKLVQSGVNPNAVFAAQERYKDIHHLKDDGSHAKFGIENNISEESEIPLKYIKPLQFNEIPTKNKIHIIDNYSPNFNYIVEGDKIYYMKKGLKDNWVDISDNNIARKNLYNFLGNKYNFVGYDDSESEILKQISDGSFNYEDYHRNLYKKEGSPTKSIQSLNTFVPTDLSNFFEYTNNFIKNNTPVQNTNSTITIKKDNNTKEKPLINIYDNSDKNGNISGIPGFIAQGLYYVKRKMDVPDGTSLLPFVTRQAISGLSRRFDKSFKQKEEISSINIPNLQPQNSNYSFIPNSYTGDTLSIRGNNRRYFIPESLNLKEYSFGVRNRGDYTELNSNTAPVTTFHSFLPYGQHKKNSNTYIGIDKDGNLKVGDISNFKEGDFLSPTFANDIYGFAKDKNNNYIFKDDAKHGNSSRNVVGMLVKDKNGDIQIKFPLNILVNKNDVTASHFGNVDGGRVIMKAGNELRLVSGSVRDIEKEYNAIKERQGTDYVTFYTLDNGSYNRALRVRGNKIIKSDLTNYDAQNNGGGNFMYIKGAAVPKFPSDTVLTPFIRTINDESYKKGHSLINERQGVVLHHTGYLGDKDLKAVTNQFLYDTKQKSSSHVIIGEDGRRRIFATPDKVTFHGGASMFNGRSNVNDFMLGIEFQGDTNKQPLTDAQIESAIEYLKPILKENNIPLENITTHEIVRKLYNDYVNQYNQNRLIGKLKNAPNKPDITQSQYERIINALIGTVYYKKDNTNNKKLGGSINNSDFQNWYHKIAKLKGLNLNPYDKEHYYDYESYYNNEIKPNPVAYEAIRITRPDSHFPDTYKLPGHETFSDESIYSNNKTRGGHWEGDKFINSNFTKSYKKPNSETKLNNDYLTIPLKGNPLYDITGETKYKSDDLDNPESRKFILDALWAMENPYGQGLNKDGTYSPYGDPNGEDQDVGPGILLSNLPFKDSYTKEELEDYAYGKVLEGRNKIRQSFDAKYGQGEYDKLDDTRKYIMDDVRYRYGTVSQSEWPNLYQAIYDNDIIKALTNARTKFKNKKGEVIGWDNNRIEKLAQYFYPDIVVEHKGNKDTYLKVYKKK